jgi:hypothetical protein
MSLPLKPPRPSVQWLGEPDLAFVDGLPIDPKVGSRIWPVVRESQPSASVTTWFIGTAGRIATARTWLARRRRRRRR